MPEPTAPADRAVVVTGASTGIGAAAAAGLAAAGFVVYAGVRSDAAGAAIAGERIRPLRLDVREPAEIAAAAERIAADGVVLAGLVNNAGVAVGGPLEHVALADLRTVLETNLVGALAVTQAFLPALRAARGRIVFVGSIAGRIATPFVGPYAASKFGLRAIADALRVELASDGISVTLLEPGSIRTPIWQKGLERREKLLAALPPDGRARYDARLQKLFAGLQREDQRALPVERVTRVIVDALTVPRPPADRLIGMQARIGALFALLPARVRNGIFSRM